jgi:alcohol dehydrogenase class IV
VACEFLVPKKIVNGEGALTEAASAIAGCGTKALIVTDAVMKKLGNLQLLTEALDTFSVQYSVYSEVNSEPTDKMVYEGVRRFAADGCNFLIALGGGSPMDTMKAIALMNGYEGRISDFMGKKFTRPTCPMVAIPTTAGTGSEATQFTIITDTSAQVKMLISSESLIPDIAVIDSIFTKSAPHGVTASTGLDALCHAIESYTSRKAQPLSKVFSLSAAKLIFENLEKCCEVPDDMDARSAMSLAALQAGIGFNNASVTIIHGMSRPIGALFHVPHGLSNALLMEACLRFAAVGAPDKFAAISRYCGLSDDLSDEAAAESLIERIHELLVELHIPAMSELGIGKDAFYGALDKMADDALASGSPQNTWRQPSKQDIIALYKEVYR